MKAVIEVSGMMCSHCEKRVSAAVLAVDGVKKCAASAKKGEVRVDFDEAKANLEQIKAAISAVGYEVK